jgi:hypothetical protein
MAGALMPHYSRRRKIGFLVVIMGCIPYGFAYWHANRYNWTPLNYRIELHEGTIRTPVFVPEVDGRYILSLEVDPRKMDHQRLNCLLDLEMSAYKERCASIPSVVDLSWDLWSGGHQVADNTSEQTWRGGEYSNDSTRREIGRFHAVHGRPYTLNVEFHQDPRELNAANPRLVAESQQDWWGFAVETQGSFAVGIISLIVGVALIRPFRRSTSG